jgi:hypothetical protein
MQHPWLASIDFAMIEQKAVEAPYKPDYDPANPTKLYFGRNRESTEDPGLK